MRPFVAAVILSVATSVFAQTSAPTSTSAPALPLQKANVAAPKVGKDGTPVKVFMEKHEKYLKRAQEGNVDLLFLGDSITEGWNSNGKTVFPQYEKYHAANFGISGDKTQHVLWRIENGEYENIKPKVVVLMIGTNNVGSNPPEQIADGVKKIVDETREKLGAKVLLLGVFPRGKSEEDPKAKAARDSVRKINEIISRLDDGKTVFYLDLWQNFVEKDGSISQEMMRDYLHPTPHGYQVWAEGMNPLLTKLMEQK